ncbi:MAG: type II toxin-antitoxin system RelE family toxin [Mycobacteriales bacterium]
MTFQVRFEPEAARHYKKLDRTVQRKVDVALPRLAADPRGPATRALVGYPGVHRIKAGRDYRVIYLIEDGQAVIVVIDVGHRRDIYRRLA